MPRRRATTDRDVTGHSDTPRQDSQRPGHADHADAGGQESTSRRSARTQQAAGTRPEEAPPVPGQRQADPPLPRGGRQPERPGQDARAKDVIGAREGLADAESAVETRKPRLRRR